MIGRTLGHYRIAERLGKGGMGEIYLAEDSKLHRKVALKILPAQLAEDPEWRRRFEREAQAVAALNHPNIVVVHSVEEAEGVHFITMELVEGRTLSELIPKDGLPLGRFFELAVPLADAISAVHARGITHRDLKPENVMVTVEGRLKVLDFGLAKLSERAPAGEAGSTLSTATTTEPGRILGTIAYMSPEQAEGRPVDPRSDIFSLGVVLYVMATGRRPFEGDTPASILSAVLKDTPPPVTERRPALPKELGRIVRLCLQKDPERRYQTAKDIRNELVELKQEVDSGALQLPAAEQGRRPRARFAAAAGLGVLALGISIYALFFRGEATKDGWAIRPLTTSRGFEGSPTWNPDGSLIAYNKVGPEGTDIYVMPTAGGDPMRLTHSPPDNGAPRWSPTGDEIAFLSDRGADLAICVIPPVPGPARELCRSRGPVLGAMPWSPNGKELLFQRDFALLKIDIKTGEETPLTEPGIGAGAAWSPDGKWIAFQRLQGERLGLWLLAAEGGEPRSLLVDEYSNQDPAWSADGRRIIFVSDRSRSADLWEIDVDSRRLQRLTVGPDAAGNPAVARDGRIAFSQFREGGDLYICRVADGTHRQITSRRGISVFPRFDPEGKRLVFYTLRAGNHGVWMLDLESGAERQLSFEGEPSGWPDWSPDGRQVVFVSSRGDGAIRLWVLDVDGGMPRRLMDRSVSLVRPRWSPDGRAISFYDEDDVWAVDPNGGDPRQLLSGSGVLQQGEDVSGFDWYGDSRHAVYSRLAEDGSGEPEMYVRDLESGKERRLFRGVHAEPIVSRDGLAVAFCRGDHLHQELCVLRLRPPDTPDGLPEPIGEPQQLTEGKGAWHVHNGGWSPDGKEIAYTHAAPESEILIIENYR